MSNPAVRTLAHGHKYRASPTLYNGRRYASKLEALYAQQLDWGVAAGDIRGWTAQVRLPLVVNGQLVCTYVADFEVTLVDGTTELHETKGFETAVWRLKRKLIEALYPDVRLVVVRREDIGI